MFFTETSNLLHLNNNIKLLFSLSSQQKILLWAIIAIVCIICIFWESYLHNRGLMHLLGAGVWLILSQNQPEKDLAFVTK